MRFPLLFLNKKGAEVYEIQRMVKRMVGKLRWADL